MLNCFAGCPQLTIFILLQINKSYIDLVILHLYFGDNNLLHLFKGFYWYVSLSYFLQFQFLLLGALLVIDCNQFIIAWLLVLNTINCYFVLQVYTLCNS